MTFKISASYVSDYFEGQGGPSKPQEITVGIRFPRGTDRAVAEALAAEFPKSAKVKVVTLSTHTPGDFSDAFDVPTLRFRADLRSNGVNGGVNETGLRRYRSLRRTIEKLGLAVEWTATSNNSYATEADFESAVA